MRKLLLLLMLAAMLTACTERDDCARKDQWYRLIPRDF